MYLWGYSFVAHLWLITGNPLNINIVSLVHVRLELLTVVRVLMYRHSCLRIHNLLIGSIRLFVHHTQSITKGIGSMNHMYLHHQIILIPSIRVRITSWEALIYWTIFTTEEVSKCSINPIKLNIDFGKGTLLSLCLSNQWSPISHPSCAHKTFMVPLPDDSSTLILIIELSQPFIWKNTLSPVSHQILSYNPNAWQTYPQDSQSLCQDQHYL